MSDYIMLLRQRWHLDLSQVNLIVCQEVLLTSEALLSGLKGKHCHGDVVTLMLSPDYIRIQSEFLLCKPPSSAQDIHQLNGLLRNAFTLMAMLDYPYSTHFMGNMPANPVKVHTAFLLILQITALKCNIT